MRLIDEMAEIKIPLLIMSSGEPLIRKDFFELASYVSSKGIKVSPLN